MSDFIHKPPPPPLALPLKYISKCVFCISRNSASTSTACAVFTCSDVMHDIIACYMCNLTVYIDYWLFGEVAISFISSICASNFSTQFISKIQRELIRKIRKRLIQIVLLTVTLQCFFFFFLKRLTRGLCNTGPV